MTHERKCWDCGYLGQFTSDVVPGVLCPKCGSQDTRRQRSEQEASQITLDDFLRETADEFAKAHAKQAAADAKAGCPHCGSRAFANDEAGRSADWLCGSFRFSSGTGIWQSNHCRSAEAAKQRDGIVEAVTLKLWSRSAHGLATYGTTLEHNHARLRDRIAHLQEELMDACNYCEWILQYINDRAAVVAVESERNGNE